MVEQLRRRRPDLDDPGQVVAIGWDRLRQQIERFVDVGFSKFVVVPLDEPNDASGWDAHLATAAEALLPLQT